VLVLVHGSGATAASDASTASPPRVSPETLYVLFWRLGFALGVVAALWVLAEREALRCTTVLGIGVALLGFLYGAKVQLHLLDQPLRTALLVSPSELLAPGYRIPLALVTMMVSGLAWSVLWRADWRAMGDALALLGPVLQAIGRFGCFLNGCCTGKVTDLPWGVVYGWHSDAHMLHTTMDWIPQDAAWSLPVHPLPLYYASFAAIVALLMIQLVRRGAAAGSLVALALVVEPPVRLALEQLRGGFPWRDWSSVLTTLAAWAVVDAMLLAAWFWPEHRETRVRAAVPLGEPPLSR
jgi:prolipoprotein diacylglyceryltransferase